MSQTQSETRLSLPVVRGFGETTRPDRWWVTPLVVFLVLSSFIGYATWAAFQNDFYYDKFGDPKTGEKNNYLSPFYSPEIWRFAAFLVRAQARVVAGLVLPFSPALIILPFPAFFRFTCYYYRGAYYKAFWADPPSCSVGEPRKSYWGENSFPLIMQNIHRYFLYFALLFIVFLAIDVWHAMWFTQANGQAKFGIGLGTLVLATNVVLLSGYTFGCHSLRHLVGGGKDEVSKSPMRQRMYDCVSCLNRKHMVWAWCSLFWVAFSDIYVRMVSLQIWKDLRII